MVCRSEFSGFVRIESCNRHEYVFFLHSTWSFYNLETTTCKTTNFDWRFGQNWIWTISLDPTPMWFEPATSGFEIQCAIQLRHGVCFGCLLIWRGMTGCDWMWCGCGAKRICCGPRVSIPASQLHLKSDRKMTILVSCTWVHNSTWKVMGKWLNFKVQVESASRKCIHLIPP